MQPDPIQFPATPIALKMAVAIGIGMLAGMEREWSSKDVGIRTFAIVALLGMLSVLIGQGIVLVSLAGVFLLVAAMNARSLVADRSVEITTSAALIVNYLLGVLVGLGHIFTPVAGAIVMTMLLAWKSELSRFAGGLQPAEIRSAVLLGLIGFVIYPVLPKRYIDPWQLFNPSDAWISVIAIAGIGFVNYVLLRMYSTRGLYFGALFGGLVNSSATVAEPGGKGGGGGHGYSNRGSLSAHHHGNVCQKSDSRHPFLAFFAHRDSCAAACHDTGGRIVGIPGPANRR